MKDVFKSIINLLFIKLNNINYKTADNRFKCQIAFNISKLDNELSDFNNIKRNKEKDFIIFDIERDKLNDKYSDREINGDVITDNTNNIKIKDS